MKRREREKTILCICLCRYKIVYINDLDALDWESRNAQSVFVASDYFFLCWESGRGRSVQSSDGSSLSGCGNEWGKTSCWLYVYMYIYIYMYIYFNHKTCTRWRRWVSFSDSGESDVDRRNRRNRPTLSADAIHPCVPGLGLNRIYNTDKVDRWRATLSLVVSYFSVGMHFVRFIVLRVNVTTGIFLQIKHD